MIKQMHTMNIQGLDALGSTDAYVASSARFSGPHSTARPLMNSTSVDLRALKPAPVMYACACKARGWHALAGHAAVGDVKRSKCADACAVNHNPPACGTSSCK